MVAIVVIIMSIILPVFTRARDYAMRTLCGSNQHNWGIAVRSYATANRGFFPDNRYLTGAAIPPTYKNYRPGFDISWNSSVVQQFWREYLVENDENAKTDEHDVLNCPTQKWHQVNDINLAGGLVGYFYMPGRSPNNGVIYTYAGNDWVFKDRFGGKAAYAPIMSDMKQYSYAWGSWFFPEHLPKGGSPISSHVRRTGEPEGGNFLFEDAHVTWYDSDPGSADPNPADPNDIITLGATIGSWSTYYKIPLE